MCGVSPTLSTGTGLWYTFLVTGKFNEATQIVLTKCLQCIPEKLYVCVGVHQSYLVHSVCL